MLSSLTDFPLWPLIVLAALIDFVLIWAIRQRRRKRGTQRDSGGVAVRFPPLFSSRIQQRLLFAGTFLLALLPSLLVVADRWFAPPAPIPRFIGPWCGFKFLCRLRFPPYFVYVFLSLSATLVLVWIQRRKESSFSIGTWLTRGKNVKVEKIHIFQYQASIAILIASSLTLFGTGLYSLVRGEIPGILYGIAFMGISLGWFLKVVPVERLRDVIRQRGRVFVVILLAHLLFVGGVAQFHLNRGVSFVSILLFVLSLAVLFPYRREVPPIYWIMSLALLLYTNDVDAWWFAIVGDEYDFYRVARHIAEESNWSELNTRLFDGQGVYGTHAYFSSILQAISIKILGDNNFGWRFSSLYFSALSTGFFYVFFKAFVQKRVALLAAFLLAVSHYLMAFGKIGYNNLQALFALSLALAIGVWVVRSQRSVAFYALGMVLGLCFYVYPVALVVLPVTVLLLLFYSPPTSRRAMAQWVVMALPLGILIYPLLLQPMYWEAKIPGTLFTNPEIMSTGLDVLSHMASNALYSLFSPFYVPYETHFVAVSYVDPLTAAFLFIGLAVLVVTHLTRKPVNFLLTSFFVTLIIVGMMHAVPYPPTTRMHMLLPWFALFAAIGLFWIVEQADRLGLSEHLWRAGLLFTLVAVGGLNIHLAHSLSRTRMIRYQVIPVLFLREVQPLLDAAEGKPVKFLLLRDSQRVDAVTLNELKHIYRLPSSLMIDEMIIAEGTIFQDVLHALDDTEVYVILSPYLSKTLRERLVSEMEVRGKTNCEVQDAIGQIIFNLWYSLNLRSPCAIHTDINRLGSEALEFVMPSLSSVLSRYPNRSIVTLNIKVRQVLHS